MVARRARERSWLAGRAFFDVDWTPVKAALQGQAAATDPRRPVRPRARARRARSGVRRRPLVVKYFEHELPINPKLARRSSCGGQSGRSPASSAPTARQLHEFLSILTSLQNLPDLADDPRRRQPRTARTSVSTNGSARKKWRAAGCRGWSTECPRSARHIDVAVREVNGEAGRPESFNALARAARSAGLPAVVLADRVSRDQLPALFRRQRARRTARGGSRRLCRHARAPGKLHRERQRPGGAHRSPGRPLRSGALLRHAAGPWRRRPLRARRENPLEPGDRCPRAGRSPGRPVTTF